MKIIVDDTKVPDKKTAAVCNLIVLAYDFNMSVDEAIEFVKSNLKTNKEGKGGSTNV